MFEQAKLLSPKRNTTQSSSIAELANEQLKHFGIDPDTEYGQALYRTATHLYEAHSDVSHLWQITQSTLEGLSREDKTAYFNAKKFLSFQLGKVLDTLQNPFRAVHQSLQHEHKGSFGGNHYPMFDNVPALFSATPVIVRTATYVYACTEWVDDAFQGKEFTHQIYSRLLNPTNISLANAIVDMEAGPYSAEYLAWNFNSGMAAIEALLSNVLEHGDVLIVSRNVYGGVYQLLQDYFADKKRMDIQLIWFDGYTEEEFVQCMESTKSKYKDRLATDNAMHVYIESPCNPHGFVLDVSGICRQAHANGALVMLDSTLATPVLHRPLQRSDKNERPDYVMHSYTKDICGSGATTAGVVIGEGYRMFQSKGGEVNGLPWSKTMFWDVYYIKGAFLDSEKAYDVLNGMKTLPQRMLNKVINTKVFTHILASHPDIRVNSHNLDDHPNAHIRKEQMVNAWPCALFTVDIINQNIDRDAFVRFFDSLEPAFSHQVSIGQHNTIILCPALTSHSELSKAEQELAGISLTTMRIAMGTDNVKQQVAHFIRCLKMHVYPIIPGFSHKFMSAKEMDEHYDNVCAEVSAQHFRQGSKLQDLL